MIKFWLNVTEDPVTNMEKQVEMGVMVDDVKKQSKIVVLMNQVSKDVVKYRIRTEMIKLFLEELDSYLDNAFGNDFMPIGEVFEAAAIATHSAEVIARIKQDHSPEFINNYLEWLDENSHVEYHGAVRKVVLDADLDELRRHFDLFGKFKEE